MTGAEYRDTRKKLDLTQQQLAAAVGVAVSTIQAREQQPEKDVGSEAEMAIISIVGDHLRSGEAEATVVGPLE